MTTIETAFVILDRGTPTLANMRREVRGLEDDAERAGRALDHIAGLEGTTEMEGRAAATDHLASALADVGREVGQLNPKLLTYNSRLDTSERRTRKLRLETEGLAVALRHVSSIRATAHVEVDGLAAARADIAAARAELAEFGRMRVTATARTSTFAGGGGFRGGRGGLFSARNALLAGPVLLPAAQALLGGATGVVGSAGAGLLGAGAVGGAAGAVGTVGLLGGLAIGKPAAEELKETTKLQQAWTDAVRDSGVGSREAKEAKIEYDRALADNPGLKRALAETRAFNKEWREATQAGRQDYFGMRRDRAEFGQRMSGFFGGASNRIIGAVRDAQQSQLDMFATPEAMEHLDRFSRVFVHDLPIAERTLEHIEMTMMQVARAALPFFHEGVLWSEETARGWNRSTSDIGEVREGIGDLLDDTRAWFHLLGSAGDVLAELTRTSRDPGRSIVEDFDETLQRWDDWLEKNPRTAERFFADAADNTERIADALGEAVGLMNDLATTFQPVLQGATALLGGVSGLGLAAPGALGLLIGARGGFRGAFPGAAGGGIGAAGAAGAGAAGAAGAAAAGRIDWGRLRAAGGGGYSYARSQGMGRVAAARYGQSAAGRAWARQGLPGGGTVAGASLRGAAGRFLPIGAVLGGLSAYGWDGDAGEKAQVFGSTLTLGAITKPLSDEQVADQAARNADRFIDGRVANLPVSLRGSEQGLAALDAEIARLSAFKRRGRLGGFANIGLNVGSLGTDWGMSEADKAKTWGISSERFEEARDRIKLLREEREELAKLNKDHRKDLDRRHVAESEERGRRLTQSFGNQYDVYAGKYGEEVAFDKTVKGVYASMSSMRREGAKILGENTLAWAQEQAKQNPKLVDEFDWLVRNIERRFSRLGRHVEVYNGQIFEGTSAEWERIAQSMIDPAERARQEVTKAFTDIQRQASASLQALGFSPGDANDLVAAMEKGGKTKKTATTIIERSRAGIAGPVPGEGAVYRNGTGAGTGDGLGWDHIGDGLGNSGRHAGAARQRSGNNLMGAKPALGAYADAAAGFGLRVSSGARPGAITSSGNRSYHSSGDALDLAGSPDQMMAFARYAASNWGSHLEELIYTPFGKGQIKNGRPYVYTGQVAKDHFDHVHIADTDPSGSGPGGASFAFSPDTAGPGLQQVSLHGKKSKAGGVAGALANAAIASYAIGLEKKLNEHLAGGALGGAAGGGKGVLSFDQVAAIAESVGLPGVTFAQLAKGESALRVGAVGHDPGGTRGLGLWQITTGFNDDVIAMFGGEEAMLNDPYANARAAKVIYDRQGIGAWYGTKFLTDPDAHYKGDGDGIAWGGWHKEGLDKTFDKPTIIGVAEGGKPERVQVTPEGQGSAGNSVVFQAGAFQLSIGGDLDRAKVLAIVDPLFVEFSQKVAAGLGAGSSKELMS